MPKARPSQYRLRRLMITSGVVATAVGALSACTGSAAGTQDNQDPAPITPTVSAEFVTPSPIPTSAVTPSSASPTPNATPTPTESIVVTATPSVPADTTDDSSAPTSTPTLLPEVTAPTDPQEIADRQAVEAAWIRFWDYYPTFEELSPAERQEIAEAISVDPLKTQILQGAANADANGETGYGTVTHRVSWYQSIDGQQQIAIADCMDQSQAGTSEKNSGKKLTKGFPRENIRGDLVYNETAGWRVRNLYYMPDDEPC